VRARPRAPSVDPPRRRSRRASPACRARAPSPCNPRAARCDCCCTPPHRRPRWQPPFLWLPPSRAWLQSGRSHSCRLSGLSPAPPARRSVPPVGPTPASSRRQRIGARESPRENRGRAGWPAPAAWPSRPRRRGNGDGFKDVKGQAFEWFGFEYRHGCLTPSRTARALEQRRDDVDGVFRRDHRNELELAQILPLGHPLLQQAGVVTLHELKASVQFASIQLPTYVRPSGVMRPLSRNRR